MNIRAALPKDLSSWSHMRSQLWPNSRDAHVAEISEYFNATSIDIVQAYFIEDDLKTPVGFIELNIRSFAEGSRQPRVPYIEAWYVDPEYRGQGFGKKLIAKAERWAQDQGFNELASDTEIDNHVSISMHNALGFKETERVVCFLKQLSPTR